MLFNSIEFAIFLPVVFLLYWFVFRKSIQIQNAFLVAASFFFYGWWDWRFLFLLVFSAGIDFIVAQLIVKTDDPHRKKSFLLLSIVTNLSILGFFKYFNFFVDNFVSAFRLFGQEFHPFTLHVILPVGISFYTFQALSYTIDVYRGKLAPTKDLGAYMAFISFFPQLVAGPIERATNFLPQFLSKRVFDYPKAVDGLRQILWGLFKKVVIADNCAQYVDTIFNGYADYSGSTLLLGAIFFAFQIYGDFSGYSDIAIGTARFFGFDLMQNFNFPYFSRDIAEFWRRWHISLSTWFRDYLYIPLQGSRGSTVIKIRNTFIIFIVSGFWHGANWTYITWGALNALYFMPLLLTKSNRKNLSTVALGRTVPTVKETAQMSTTFILTTLGWVVFRAADINQAFGYIAGIFDSSLFSTPRFTGMGDSFALITLIFFFMIIEWIGREKKYAFQIIENNNKVFQLSMLYLLGITILLFMNTGENDFIYFQF